MSEDKTEDTKSPLARRGARPFVGPAGGSPAARPFLRPAAAPPRPGAAPFVPQDARPRPALGATPNAPVAPPQPAPTPAPSVGPASPPKRAPTPVATAALPTAESDPFFPAEPEATTEQQPSTPARPITSELVAIDAFDAFESVWATGESRHEPPVVAPEPAPPLDEASLGGLDAHDLWGDDITATDQEAASSAAAPVTAEPIVPTAPSAELEFLTGEETAASAVVAEPSGEAARVSLPSADVGNDSGTAIPATPAASALPETRSELEMPAWLADDHEPTGEVHEALDASLPVTLPDQPAESAAVESPAMWPHEPAAGETLAPAPDIAPHPSNDSTDVDWAATPFAVPPADATESFGDAVTASDDAHNPSSVERPRFELVDSRQAQAFPSAETASEAPGVFALSAHTASARNVSVALDRLAEQVRRGEIDVSSIAPEATDAAILASVLAALLGGSSSR